MINEIKGFDHSGTQQVGTPAIFGMNFQTVSTAEKLPESNELKGGYEADGVTPGPLLRRALDLNARGYAPTCGHPVISAEKCQDRATEFECPVPTPRVRTTSSTSARDDHRSGRTGS